MSQTIFVLLLGAVYAISLSSALPTSVTTTTYTASFERSVLLKQEEIRGLLKEDYTALVRFIIGEYKDAFSQALVDKEGLDSTDARTMRTISHDLELCLARIDNIDKIDSPHIVNLLQQSNRILAPQSLEQLKAVIRARQKSFAETLNKRNEDYFLSLCERDQRNALKILLKHHISPAGQAEWQQLELQNQLLAYIEVTYSEGQVNHMTEVETNEILEEMRKKLDV